MRAPLVCPSSSSSPLATHSPPQEFASAGIKHFRVWTLNNNTVKSQSGIWGKQPNANNILLTVVASPQGDDYVCGAIDGSLQIFKNNVLS